jgi:hypothetical protein
MQRPGKRKKELNRNNININKITTTEMNIIFGRDSSSRAPDYYHSQDPEFEPQYHKKEMNNIFVGSSLDLSQQRKESMSLKIHQFKLPRQMERIEKDQNIQESCDDFKRYNVHIIKIAKKRKKEQEKDLKCKTMAKNFLKLKRHRTTK